jgi:60 kDa SS-A/Ro ribonucleoprotein
MAKTNLAIPSTRLTTHEGAPARRITARDELQRTLMACLLWEDTFYESGESVADRLAAGALGVSWPDVSSLAVEARTVSGLRHAPLWVLVNALQRPAVDRRGWADAFAACCKRPDDVAEALSLYWKDGRKPIPAQFKKGIARAIQKFTAYQLGKYNRDGAIKLRDLLFLSHAKPKDEEQAAAWKALIGGTLAAPDTWEVALSSGADKKATWERLLVENKLGALALVRNLRNMVQAGVDRSLVLAALETMRTDLVWPFQFIAAERHAPEFSPAIEGAMLRALVSAPRLPGRTILLVDASGSMSGALSSRSELTRFDAACGLAILLREICADVRIARFETYTAEVAARRGFALRDALGYPSGGTNTETAKRWADQQGYDRLVIITDEQSHQALSNPTGRGYVLNVASYKNGIGYGPWTHIDGWSEHVARYIAATEAA